LYWMKSLIRTYGNSRVRFFQGTCFVHS
jgi:hypothetical protein